jgi:glutamate synthase (NADPH/NADH) large chain
MLDTQQAFGYTQEDVKSLILCRMRSAPMARRPIGSMGNDSPLAVLVASGQTKTLYDYFKQLLRPGHESADRPHPRRTRDVAGLVRRPEGRTCSASMRSASTTFAWKSISRSSTDQDLTKIRHIDAITGGNASSSRSCWI